MYKSRQKIIGVSVASLVVLGGFAVGTWAIIDSSNKMPKGNANVSRYEGITQYLGNGSLDVSKMSISDWINLNYPTKILVDGVNKANYSLYYFTTPTNTNGITDQNWTALKDPEKLLSLVNAPSSPLICKIDISETANSYSYTVNLNSYYTENIDPFLASASFSFSDSNKTQIIGFDTKGININNHPSSIDNNIIKYNDYSAKYTTVNATDKIDYKMEVTSLTGSNDVVYTWELKTNPTNNYSNFQIINSGAKIGESNTTGIFSTYTNQTIDSTIQNKDNYKIYNVAHQRLNNNAGGETLTKQTYQTFWKTTSDSELPPLHLPNSIGLLGFLPPINKANSNT